LISEWVSFAGCPEEREGQKIYTSVSAAICDFCCNPYRRRAHLHAPDEKVEKEGLHGEAQL